MRRSICDEHSPRCPTRMCDVRVICWHVVIPCHRRTMYDSWTDCPCTGQCMTHGQIALVQDNV